MSVAAVGRSLSTRASYSGTGSHCEITAPGGDAVVDGVGGLIYQTMLDEPGHTAVNPGVHQLSHHRHSGHVDGHASRRRAWRR